MIFDDTLVWISVSKVFKAVDRFKWVENLPVSTSMKEICRLGVLSRLVLPAASLSGQFFSTKSMVNSIMLMLSSSSMEFHVSDICHGIFNENGVWVPFCLDYGGYVVFGRSRMATAQKELTFSSSFFKILFLFLTF